MKFVIEGKPIPWMRAGRHGWRYYDRQHAMKEKIRALVKSQMKNKKPLSGPLKLTIEFHMVIPSSWRKKRHENAIKKPHRCVPDIDNLTKFVNDALNGILWEDDGMIFHIDAKKFYSKRAKTILKVEEYPDEEVESQFPEIED